MSPYLHLSTKLQKLPAHLRPREKLLKFGPQHLSDTELLALILGSGSGKQHVLSLAKHLEKHLKRENLEIPRLTQISGLGLAQAARLVASFELAQRWQQPATITAIHSPSDVLHYVGQLRRSQREQLLVLFLNSRSQVLSQQTVAVGSLTALQLKPREIFAPAMNLPCSALIVVHNHPSQDTTPSPEDLTFTQKLVSAGELLGIHVLDHLIVTAQAYLSFREQNLLTAFKKPL